LNRRDQLAGSDVPLLEDLEEVLDVLLGDGPAHAHVLGVGHRHRQRHIAMGHPEHQVLRGLAGRVLALLPLLDDSGTVVRVDDLVAGLEHLGASGAET